MKSVLRIVILILLPGWAGAQAGDSYESGLFMKLKNAANDTIRMDVYRQLGFYHQDSDADTGLVYHMEQLNLAEKLKLRLWEADAHEQIGYCFTKKYKFSEAYENYMLALKIAEDPSSALNSWGY